MKPTAKQVASSLKTELDFVEHGGYRKHITARQPLFCMETSPGWTKPTFFEDSPICPKRRHANCDPESDCVLMSFVPQEHRKDVLPCHHIPLNDQGDTIDSLENKGDRKAVLEAIRSWAIANLQKSEIPH